MAVTLTTLDVYGDSRILDVFEIAQATIGADTFKYVIVWDEMDDTSKAELNEFVDFYGGNPIATTAGSQTIGFGGTIVGGNPSGLTAQRVCFVRVTIDGTKLEFNLNSATAITFNDVVTQLNAALGGAATAAIVGGDIVVTSATTGPSSTVWFDFIHTSAFAYMTGYKNFLAPINGVTGSLTSTYEAMKSFAVRPWCDLSLYDKYIPSIRRVKL